MGEPASLAQGTVPHYNPLAERCLCRGYKRVIEIHGCLRSYVLLHSEGGH